MTQQNGKFRILIYGEFFLPVVGGVQTAMNLLATGLVGLNSQPEKEQGLGTIEVTVATRTTAGGMDDSVFPYCVVRRPGFRQLIGLIREADVVHVAGPCLLPTAVGWLIGKPVIVEHHGYQAICPNGLLFREPSRTVCPGYFGQMQYGKCVQCTSQTVGFLSAIRTVMLTFPRRWLCKKVSANIMISNHVATRLNLPRACTVYYGIEALSNARTAHPTPSKGPFQMAYVGRLVSEKGPALVLEAAKCLREDSVPFHLSFMGDGPERANLESLTDKLGLRSFTSFSGDLRGPEFEEAVAKVDLVVMPSRCEETAGLSAIEQMMRGKAVIVADIGGLSEVVGDGGLKFPPGDSQALAVCIRKVIDNPRIAAALGSVARDRAAQLFKQDSMIRNHLSVYRQVAS